MKQFWIFTLMLLFSLSGFAQFRPSVITVKKVSPPITLEGGFTQLDSILEESFKQEIKNLPIDIATIKLEHSIGQFLLFKWKLNYQYNNGFSNGGFSSDAPPFINDFFEYGIKEPSTTRRVIFRSYYKHLNSIPVNVRVEAEYYKQLLGQYSFEISSQSTHFRLDNRIRHNEDSILNDYKTTFISVSDTLGIILWNKRCATKCLLSGILLEKGENYTAEIYLFDIACSNRNTYALSDSIKIELYDTISYDLRECILLNYDYPTHTTLDAFLWNSYVNEKYTK